MGVNSIQNEINIIIKDIKKTIGQLKTQLNNIQSVDDYLKTLHGQFSNIELKLHKLKEPYDN